MFYNANLLFFSAGTQNTSLQITTCVTTSSKFLIVCTLIKPQIAFEAEVACYVINILILNLIVTLCFIIYMNYVILRMYEYVRAFIIFSV